MDQHDAILSRLLTLHPKKIDLSLGRTERLLAALGRPDLRLPPIIHVAGTNGKGSTIAFLRAMLEAAGQRVHVYTSPHLLRFNERIRLGADGGGKLVDDERLNAALERCEQANAGQPITFFEITTAAAFSLFAETPADWLLLETGLGGRYDATNVISQPKCAIITSISLDHLEFLGDTVEKIAHEKAGILKKGAPAIIGFQSEPVARAIEREARRVGASPLIVAGRDFDISNENGRLVYEDEHGLLDLPLPRLAGRHQHENAAGAIAALRAVALEIPNSAIEAGLTRAEWPARLQRLTQGHIVDLAPSGSEVWLDGGHNEDGGRVLAEAMAEFHDKSPRPLALICGAQTTKDIRALLKHFVGLAREVVAVPVEGEHKSWPPDEVASLARAEGIPGAAASGVEEALKLLSTRSFDAPPRVLIAGSLYLAASVLAANGSVID